MKILVFGGTGKIGNAVAWDLVKDPQVEAVGLVGRRRNALIDLKKKLKSKKVAVHQFDIADAAKRRAVMKRYDVGVVALPDRKTSYVIVEAAIREGLHIVDMLEEYHRRPDAYETEGLKLPRRMSLDEYGDFLHEKAIENNVTFLDGIGFAPGLSNVTLGEAIRKLDITDTAVARVGGIPSKEASERHPLKYMVTWAFWHVLREYMIKVKIIKGGEIVEEFATGDRERFRFTKFAKDEELECAVTPGMPSFIYTRPQLRNFAEKTIRWPGHWSGIDTLKECGLLSLDPVRYEGRNVVPRDLLFSIIEPKMRPRKGDTDVCVMWNSAIGEKGGKPVRIDYYMWDAADTKLGFSSMARVTGFPAAVSAKMIASGKITKRGIVPPEDAIEGNLYDEFMEEMRKRDIIILEEQTLID